MLEELFLYISVVIDSVSEINPQATAFSRSPYHSSTYTESHVCFSDGLSKLCDVHDLGGLTLLNCDASIFPHLIVKDLICLTVDGSCSSIVNKLGVNRRKEF